MAVENTQAASPPSNPAIPSRIPATTSDRLMNLMRVVSDNQVRLIIEFDGLLDAERLKRTVRMLLDVEPILGCRFVERWWQPYWERMPNLDDVDFFELIVTENKKEALDDFLFGVLDPGVGPQMLYRIFRSETDTLALRFNHEVFDGGGGRQFLGKLVEIYNRLEEDPDYRPEPNVTGRRSMKQISCRLSFRDKLKVIRRFFRDWRTRNFPRGNWAFPARNAEPRGPRFTTGRLTPELYTAVRAFSKQNKLSMNDIMIAAVFRSLSRIIKPKAGTPLRLRLTVDLRRFLPSGISEAASNLSGSGVILLPGRLGDSLVETAGLVRTEMNRLKNDFIGMGEWVLWPVIKWFPFRWMQNLFRNLIKKKKKGPPLPPQVSNGGLFPIFLFRLGDVKVKDIWFGGGLIRVPNFQFNFFGVDDTLVFSVSTYDSIIDPALVDEVFEKVQEELTEGTFGPPSS